MSSTDRTEHGTDRLSDGACYALAVLVLLALAVGYGSLWFGYWVNGHDTAGLGTRFLNGDVTWHPGATTAAVTAAGVLFALWVAGMILRARRGSKALRIDRAAPHMAQPSDVAHMTAKGRARQAKAKGLPTTPLPALARNVNGGAWLHMGPEATATMIAGPRSGKSSAFAIPRICEWEGPVLVTSNKRDLVDATRAWRERNGARAWVFDPQRIMKAPATWYWDPIVYVTDGDPEAADIRANKLAHRFAFAGGQSSGNAGYFNLTGEGLVAALILAAALGGFDIMAVRSWISNAEAPTPVRLLREHGYEHAADRLASLQKLTDEQRDGVYGTADSMTEFLTYRTVAQWITPGNGRVPFDPYTFVHSGDTLYSISREGQGSMGPLVTALTVAVCEAAEEIAQDSPGGRLATPLALVLDEVANVCRWQDLPNVYSHYGSKGILPICFLQSWEQGVTAWGKEGMGALWSHSTTRILGSAVFEHGVLQSASDMIGKYTKAAHSTSRSKAGTSSSTQSTKDDVLSTADLGEMPPERALIFEAGTRRILAETVPWFERDYADELKATQGGTR